MNENFWIALISANHKDLVPALDLLNTSLKPKTTDSMIVAACRTEHAIQVLQVLLRDIDFRLSEQTISAVFRENVEEETFKFLL